MYYSRKRLMRERTLWSSSHTGFLCRPFFWLQSATFWKGEAVTQFSISQDSPLRCYLVAHVVKDYLDKPSSVANYSPLKQLR